MRKIFPAGNVVLQGLFALAVVAIVTSCDIINPTEEIPSYVYVDSIRFETGPLEGSNSSKITEVWFYAGGEFLGAYGMPAKIPVLMEGETEIIIFPGIRDNGILSMPDIYPFYTRQTIFIDLDPAKIDTIEPLTAYQAETQFAFIEDFESAHLFIDDQDEDPETEMIITNTEVFEGTGSGRITLTNDHDLIEVATITRYSEVPTNGSPVYLEMNYMNEVTFAVGLIGHQAGMIPATYYIITLRPRDFWNKIYINLTEALNQSDLAEYQIVFLSSLDEDLDEGNIYLDNIKFLYLE